MDNGKFPNFDTGIHTRCNFQRGEIQNRIKCEGKIFAKETSQFTTFLKQDNLKEMLVDTEAKGIKTHKECDKQQFKEILPYINDYYLVLEVNLLHKLEKKQHINIYRSAKTCYHKFYFPIRAQYSLGG